jgi:serine/threonine-protein kinase
MFSDRYRLDLFLASGGMGEVWRATDVALGRVVAVKVLLPAVLSDPSFAVRFRAEARTLASFHHPNIVDVYDFGEHPTDDGAVAYLVMACIDGQPLSHRIASAGRLPVAETLSIVAQVAEALHAAHTNGVVHRDVKPSNLLVRADGTVVLVDFGVARSTALTANTNAGGVPGTVLYMAPEQISGQQVTAATDVYALGAVAYHCLAGHPPFDGKAALQVALQHLHDPLPPLPADIPGPVQTLVGRALAKDPGDRYPSAAALAAAARAAAQVTGEHPTGAPPEVGAVPAAAYPGPATMPDLAAKPVTPTPPRTARRRVAAAIVAVVTGLLAAAVVTAVLAMSPAGGQPSPVDGPAHSPGPASTGPSPTGRARTTPPAQPSQPSATPGTPGAATPSPQTTPTRSASPDRSIPPTTRSAPVSTVPASTVPASTAPGQAGTATSEAP